MAARRAETVFDRANAPVRRFLDAASIIAQSGEAELAKQAGAALDAYQKELEKEGVPRPAQAPARYAQGVVIDQMVRRLPQVRLNAWLAAAHEHLFDRRDISINSLSRFRDTATAEGGDLEELAVFLDGVIGDADGRRREQTTYSRGPAFLLGFGALALVLALFAYAGFLDWRQQQRLWTAYEIELSNVGPVDVLERLDRHLDAVKALEAAADVAPLTKLIGHTPLPWSTGPKARAAYEEEVHAYLPDAFRSAIGEALATEGEDLELYDTVRAWAVLSGQSDWSPAYLAGWAADRDTALGTGSLALHVAAMGGPVRGIQVPDGELYAQALVFASAAGEEDRAFLELLRQEAVAELPAWDVLENVPGLDEVFIRRSGAPVTQSVPPLFTAQGWTYAREVGIGVAVQTARLEAAALFATSAHSQVFTPDEIADRLQAETVRRWKEWLADLRVQPFVDQDRAVRVSGALSRPNSPLTELILAVWSEVTGGERTMRQTSVATAAFQDAVEYVESGKVADLSRLFASLNVALSTIELDADRGADDLMKVQELAQSVSALVAAPSLVVEITEDVLAQSGAAHGSILSNPLTKEWQTRVYTLCRQAVDGRYPFHDGPETTLEDFNAFFGPAGALNGFLAGVAAQQLEIGGEVWRWSPTARLAGVSQESAQFLQRAYSVASAFYDPAGALGDSLTVATLAERGQATMLVGGTGGAVRASGASQRMEWPGPTPDTGAEIAFAGGQDRLAHAGPWGLMKLLDRTRLRVRDGGQRHLVDVRSETGRLFLEISGTRTLNPVSGRRLARGLTCPSVL